MQISEECAIALTQIKREVEELAVYMFDLDSEDEMIEKEDVTKYTDRILKIIAEGMGK